MSELQEIPKGLDLLKFGKDRLARRNPNCLRYLTGAQLVVDSVVFGELRRDAFSLFRTIDRATRKMENKLILNAEDNGNINPQSGSTYTDEAMVDLNSWFFIRNPVSGLVLDSTTKSQVKLAEHNPQSLYQMWKRGPNQSLYCKGHGSNLVLDFHVKDFKRDDWGKIYLKKPNHDQNQQWILGTYIHS